jgi:hypothetical protein
VLRTICVPLATVFAAIVFAAPAVALPADKCAQICSNRSDYQRCMSSCLETE